MHNRSYKQLALVALAAVALAGCASQPAANDNGDAAAQAIQAAQTTIDNVEAPCTDTGNAADLLQQARDAQESGDNATAEKLATQADQTASETVNDCYLDHAKSELAQVQAQDNLTDDQAQRLDQGQQAINNNEGKRAYEILSALNAEFGSASTTVSVVPGDTLWGIAAQGDTYGNALEWPLIYKANSNKINDPDLIYPDQQFNVPLSPSSDAVDLAVHHARNRGPWQVGQAEQSDQDYLQQAESN